MYLYISLCSHKCTYRHTHTHHPAINAQRPFPAVTVFVGISHSGVEQLLEGPQSGSEVAVIQREGPLSSFGTKDTISLFFWQFNVIILSIIVIKVYVRTITEVRQRIEMCKVIFLVYSMYLSVTSSDWSILCVFIMVFKGVLVDQLQ